MNFSKEYIKECDCEQIQGLRAQLKQGDWIFSPKMEHAVDHKKAKGIFTVMGYQEKYVMYWLGVEVLRWNEDEEDLYTESRTFDYREDLVWLPTGDQLDEEIVKICKEKQLAYSMSFEYYEGNISYVNVFTPLGSKSETIDITIGDTNPLIAKIKLLKNILKEGK